jgi:hypothetical protein
LRSAECGMFQYVGNTGRVTGDGFERYASDALGRKNCFGTRMHCWYRRSRCEGGRHLWEGG